MTYQNRMLTTPTYINSIPSAFWSLVADDISHKLGETCGHGNYLNKRVSCIKTNGNAQCIVTCNKCEYVYSSTGTVIVNMIGYFGF